MVSAEGYGSEDFPERGATPKIFPPTEKFEARHIGPSPSDVKAMLNAVGCETMEELISQTVPANIRLERPLDLPEGRPEAEMLVSEGFLIVFHDRRTVAPSARTWTELCFSRPGDCPRRRS